MASSALFCLPCTLRATETAWVSTKEYVPRSHWQDLSVQSCLPDLTAWPGLLPRIFSLLPNIVSTLAGLKEIGNALKLCCSLPVANCIFWPFISTFSNCYGALGSSSQHAWRMRFVQLSTMCLLHRCCVCRELNFLIVWWFHSKSPTDKIPVQCATKWCLAVPRDDSFWEWILVP